MDIKKVLKRIEAELKELPDNTEVEGVEIQVVRKDTFFVPIGNVMPGVAEAENAAVKKKKKEKSAPKKTGKRGRKKGSKNKPAEERGTQVGDTVDDGDGDGLTSTQMRNKLLDWENESRLNSDDSLELSDLMGSLNGKVSPTRESIKKMYRKYKAKVVS